MSINFKVYSCLDKYGNSTKLADNQISLYIVLTRKCNAQCKFCEYNKGESNIDLKLLSDIIKKLDKQCTISTVHFTGGEPTIELDKLKEILKIIKNTNGLIITSVNTNGIRLNELEGIEELDNISLSRHAISDVDNQNIFGTNTVPTYAEISNFNDKHKLHLSCNLIKGYIDSESKVLDYLEFASKLGINDVGLVGLMPVNEFCKNNFISAESLNIRESDRLIKNRYFRNINESGQLCCMCNNYLYRAHNMNLVSIYYRCALLNNQIADYLVYDNNILKQGFNGNIIEI